MVTPMMDEQMRLEEEMRGVTQQRYYKLHEKAEERGDLADTHAGRNLFDAVYQPYFNAVEEWYQVKISGQAGKKATAARMMKDFGDLHALVFIAVKHLINTTLVLGNRSQMYSEKGARMTASALSIAGAIHDELRMRYFEDERKALLKRIVQDFQQRDLPRRRRRELMIKQFHTQQLTWEAEGWTKKDRLQLGLILIDIFRTSTGMIDEFVLYGNNKSINCVGFTEEAVDILKDRMEAASDLFTVYYPLVVPPKPWVNGAMIGGSYYTDNVQPYKLIKSVNVKYLSELEARDMSSVIEPINAMQDTGWRVNERMLDVLEYVFANNLNVKGLPPSDPQSIPEPPYGIETDEDIATAYRKECYMVHDMNRRAVSKRISVLRTISLGRKFAEYPAIYFPYDLDSRGRAYPKVPFLNPQGTDYVKSLLEFSEGKPIENDTQAAYLAIAVANAWGHDKLPLQERVDWTQDQTDMMIEIAENPFSDRRWLEADEPFMALRGALEWAAFMVEGYGYVSHMPVHFDATCSGLQHFSALLRDAEGGFHVNLTDADARQDIYAEVARKATASIASDTSDIAKVALRLGISRSLCKRPVMIVPYAGTFAACMTYVADHYRERMEEGEDLGVDQKYIQKHLSPFVAKHVWQAISDTVIAAREAMDWITKVARVVSKGQSSPIQWTTPDGFVVQQAKLKERGLKVDTYLDGGRRIRSTILVDSKELDAKKMAQSLSPNYIHSLDACHMRGSIKKAMEIGGMSFAMIHDSFGVHAADMDVFVNQCIKAAFVEMYVGGDNLDLFREEITVGLADHSDVPAMPSSGTLDIQKVRESEFFFS